ncbi:MAG TPA: hypothetical protein VFW89_09625 [Gemmatimonadaceae bacterium]|nr:hypothetical protein [Gemmatimonadaceae bacterium]
MTTARDALKEATKYVMNLLAQRDYRGLENLTQGIRMSANDIDRVIRAYGRHVILPPEEAYSGLTAIEILVPPPGRWSVDMPLWTEEEGESDLTVELRITLQHDSWVKVTVDDIHVL